MFKPISQSLSEFSYFAVLGFFLGAVYEVIRIIRLFKRQSDLVVGITDFVFLLLAAIVTFAYSMELGNGKFRWFYIAGEVFGAALYFLTAGRLVSLASNFIVRCVKYVLKWIHKYIISPVIKYIGTFIHFTAVKIVKSYRFILKHIFVLINHLQTSVKVVYNRLRVKRKAASQRGGIKGEERNVIKAKTHSARGSRSTRHETQA